MSSTSPDRPIVVAFGSVPKDGGTFTFYRTLRPTLLERGIDLRCVSVGRDQLELTDPAFVDEGCVQLAGDKSDLKAQAQAFAKWCDTESVDVVFGVNSPGILSALPHLPEHIRVMARCANGFDEGYRLTLVCQERLERIVALVPRLRDDLVQDYAVDPDRITLIPNGISPDRFAEAAAQVRGTGESVSLGFLGRLEHNQKGVLHIPAILDELDRMKIDYHLSIGGRGRDEPALRDALKDRMSEGKVSFLGRLTPDEIPTFLGRTDLFLFPSHFEGCPNALLEATAAGAVPVAWRLPGITDFIIRDGETGFLADVGDTVAFAARIAEMAKDRVALAAASRSASADARDRFSRQVCADRYEELFDSAMAKAPPAFTPKPWSDFSPPSMFRQSILARAVPIHQRRALRRILDRARGRRRRSPAAALPASSGFRVHQIINSIDLERGGAERLARELHNQLRAAGIDSRLITLEDFENPDDAPEGATSFGFASPYDPRSFLRLAQYAGTIAPGDVVHAHLFPTSVQVATLAKVGRIRAPVIFTEHSSSNRRRNTKWGALVDRQIYNAFTRIVPISKGVEKELLSSRPWINGATQVIPNGCRLLFDRPILRERHEAPIVIASVGRLVPAKNYETALEAIARLMPADIKYVIAGEGRDRAVLEAKVAELGLGNVVEFAGFVRDIRDILRSADIFLIPSAWEGFGLAAVEAMNASLPVVASNVPGLIEAVGTNEEAALLVDHTDPDDIANAVRGLIEDAGKRHDLGQAGFLRSLGFDIEDFVGSHVKLYEEVRAEWASHA